MVWETNRLLMEGRHFLGFLLELGHIRTSCEAVLTRRTHTHTHSTVKYSTVHRKKVILRLNVQSLSMKGISLHAHIRYSFGLNGMIWHDS